MLGNMNVKLGAAKKDLTTAKDIVDRVFTGNYPQVSEEAYEEALKHVPEHPSEDELIAEAVRRMKALNFRSDIIENFKKDRTISHVMEDGQFVPLKKKDHEQIQKLKEYGYVVYAAIRSHTIEGKMTSYIVVGDQTEDWILEQNSLKHNVLKAYVYNHKMPLDTEMGTIIFMHYSNNSLIRIY